MDLLDRRKLDELKKEKKNKKIFLAVIIISLVLTIAFLPLAIAEEVWPPFVVFLGIYAGSSFIAACTYTSIGHFFNYSLPVDSGNSGCILFPLYLFIYPAICFVSCFGFIGLISLVGKMSKISAEIALLESKKS